MIPKTSDGDILPWHMIKLLSEQLTLIKNSLEPIALERNQFVLETCASFKKPHADVLSVFAESKTTCAQKEGKKHEVSKCKYCFKLD
jgi:hypothetical protein